MVKQKTYAEDPAVYESVANRFFIDKYGDKELVNYIILAKPKSVFEVGCGTGFVTRQFPKKRNFNFIASDVNENFLEYAKKRCRGFDFIRFDATKDKLSGKADIVFGRFVFHHISDSKKIKFLKNLKKQAKEIVILDYFLPEAKSKTESIKRFHDYRRDLLKNKKSLIKIDDDTLQMSLDGVEEQKITLKEFYAQLKKAKLRIAKHKLIQNRHLNNPKLFGMHLFVLN